MNQKEHYKAFVYNHSVEIDTNNGTGFLEVLELMSIFLNKFSRWVRPETFDILDMKQAAYLATIEGIFYFNPDNKVKLSTFLHKFVYNKMVDMGRKKYVDKSNNDVNNLIYKKISPEDKIAITRIVNNWNPKDKRIVFKLILKEESIKDTAKSENMTPWGLTRRFSKIMKKAKNKIERK